MAGKKRIMIIKTVTILMVTNGNCGWIRHAIVACLIFCFGAKAQSLGGLQISASVDTVAQFGFKDNSGATDRIDIREAEVMLFAPADHQFDGALSIAVHLENGEDFFELHEAYIGSSKLIPRSRFKVGQFFLGVGRLNRFHRHDWPFTTAPYVHRTVFADEAASDTGVEFGTLLPLPFYLDLTLGITNGWVFGHAHTLGNKPLFPTHYARLVTYQDLFSGGGTETGLNYLGRRSDTGINMTLLGLDSTAKWRTGKTLTFLLQSEFWYKIESPQGGEDKKYFGLYVYPQYGLNENWYIGLRGDYFTQTNLTDALNNGVSNRVLGISPSITYRSSEFATFRLGYQIEDSAQGGQQIASNEFLELQATFILGAHPAHDF